jgi:tetratricopeptide (TPR) repeat protein
MNNLSITLLLCLLFSVHLFADEPDITDALKKINSGNIKAAESILQNLKSTNPADPSTIYLDGILTKNGDEALQKYSVVLEKFPNSKYADASLFRIFTYYYSLGFYTKAGMYLERLKKDYPESQYIKIADRSIPVNEEAVVQPVNTNPKPNNPSNSITKKYNFVIQAGAFLNEDNAKKLSDKLRSENYLTEIITKEVGGTSLNIVNVGQFVTEEDARPELSILEKKFGIKGRIVPINK